MANPRKPDKVKKELGTFRKDRSNPDAPELKPGRPTPPADLTAEELSAFWMLVEAAEETGVSDPRHHHMVTLFARAWARWERLSKNVEKFGDTLQVEAANGGVKTMRNPDSTALDSAYSRIQSILAEFGLSPAAMGRVAAKDKAKDTNPFAEIGKKPGAEPN